MKAVGKGIRKVVKRDDFDSDFDKPTQTRLQAVLNVMAKTELRTNPDVGFRKARSERGVPHIIIKVGATAYSVCWFWQRRIYRVFTPYPSLGAAQERFDFAHPGAVTDFFCAQVTLENMKKGR